MPTENIVTKFPGKYNPSYATTPLQKVLHDPKNATMVNACRGLIHTAANLQKAAAAAYSESLTATSMRLSSLQKQRAKGFVIAGDACRDEAIFRWDSAFPHCQWTKDVEAVLLSIGA